MRKLENTVSVYGSNSRQFLLARIGNKQYGFDIQDVNNLIRVGTVVRVPKAGPHLKGMINLRGEIIAVMSVLPDAAFSEDSRIVILNVRESEKIGILVDQVYDITEEEVELFDIQALACDQNILEQEGMHG